MSSAAESYNQSTGPTITQFRVLLGAVRGRFQDAIDENTKLIDQGYRAFTIDDERNITTPHYLARFNIADNKRLHDLRTAETIELGVPVDRPNLVNPDPLRGGETDYFVIYHGARETLQATSVNEITAAELVFGTEPIIHGLMHKIRMYGVVPILKNPEQAIHIDTDK